MTEELKQAATAYYAAKAALENISISNQPQEIEAKIEMDLLYRRAVREVTITEAAYYKLLNAEAAP